MILSGLLPPVSRLPPPINWFNQERQPTGAEPESYDQSATWQPKEIPLGDGRILVLDDS